MWYRDVDGGVVVSIKVIAGAKKNEIVGIVDPLALPEASFLKVKVTAQRENGKANEALIKLLSKTFECNKKDIRIVKGATKSKKLVFFSVSHESLRKQI